MTPERWRRVSELFEAALAEDRAGQAAFLARAAPDDPGLAEEVLRMLASDDKAGPFLNTPPSPILPDLVSGRVTMAGRRIGPYRILAEIAEGGMGAVYRAVRDDDQYHKQVAIKLVRGGNGSELFTERFKTERQILANLEHPNIARLIDGGETEEGWPWFSMEYVEGRPLDAYCAWRGLSTRPRLELFRTVCSAVQYAHQLLVVHRDLKPTNILVTDEGTPKLLDFGIAKLLAADSHQERTRTGSRAMTPAYASPEQVRGDMITTASDVYSLGVLLYELLSGTRPCEVPGGSPEQVLHAICEEDPPPPSATARRQAEGWAVPARRAQELEGDLDTIVLKALRKEPGRRYGSPMELSEDIRRYLDGLPVAARKDTLGYRAGKFVRRHRTAVSAACLMVASMAAGTTVAVREARKAGVERTRAERRFTEVRKLTNSFLFEFHDAIADLPGSTAARALVVKRALEYLGSLASEESGDTALQRELATAYTKVGDILMSRNATNLGQSVGARDSHEKALAIRLRLVAANPADRELRGELAISYSRLGPLRFGDGDPRGAAELHQKALSIEEALLREGPATREARSRIGTEHASLAWMLGTCGLHEQALDHGWKAIETLASIAAEVPGDPAAQGDLATAYQMTAEILENGPAAELAAALDLYRRALPIREALSAAERTHPARLYRVAVLHSHIGLVLAMQGDEDGAFASNQKGVGIVEQLEAADPLNQQYRKDLGGLFARQGALQVRRGDREAGFALLRKTLAIAESYVASEPSNIYPRASLGLATEGLGEAYAHIARDASAPRRQRVAHWRDARSFFQRARDIWLAFREWHTVSGYRAKKADNLALEIGRCDAALAELNARPP